MMPHQKKQDADFFDVSGIITDFPALKDDLAFLDSAASAQKPQAVIDAMRYVMENHYANVHRGVYDYSERTTRAYEDARHKVAGFLNAPSDKNIVFTRNTTEAINLVAQTWARQNLTADDEIILSELEHHANIVPWTMLREEIGFTIRVIPIRDDGSLDMDAFHSLLNEKTKLVSVLHVSNALGTIVPVVDITRAAHDIGAMVLIDASQSVVHLDVDVQKIDCDFLVFTGHKLYGPTGIGVLYGRENILNEMPPYQGGGEMIEKVTFDGATYKSAPTRFEAGTPAIVEAIGLGAAIEYIGRFDKQVVIAHENALLVQATAALSDIGGVTLYGTAKDKASILSFGIDGVHPHDIGTIFDQMNVAVRAGHHCCQPLMKRLGVTATVRASFALYNTERDIEKLVAAVHKVKSIFG